MVEIGQAARADPAAAATLAALREGDVDERWLALQACHGSRDGAEAVQALSDPSGRIRGLAVRLIPVICDDAHVQAAFELASPRERRIMLRRLARRGRRELVHAILALNASHDADLLKSMLPLASSELVEAHLDSIAYEADANVWRRLARWHPEIAVQALRVRLAASERPDVELVSSANSVLRELVRRAPDEALTLVDDLVRRISPSDLELQPLAQRRPVEMADRVLRWNRGNVLFTWLARHLDREQILELIRRGGITLGDRARWFPKLLPDQRASLYDAIAISWRDPDGVLEQEIVGSLRLDQREREGRRHLELPALAARPLERLPYAAFLPWDEAQTTLALFLQDPNAQVRAVALAALARATRYQLERLPDLLALARSQRNESDPVRGVLLDGFAEMPSSIWRLEHLNELETFLRAALDAPDLPIPTAAAVERLILRVLPIQPEWGSRWLATLVRERGALSLRGHGSLSAMVTRLSKAKARRVAPHLLPVLRSWTTREQQGWLPAGGGARVNVHYFAKLIETLELRQT